MSKTPIHNDLFAPVPAFAVQTLIWLGLKALSGNEPNDTIRPRFSTIGSESVKTVLLP
ncbi:MAG: hypothetical protein ACI97A_003311 [Planctomycetota bacterium]|jgi:hypothetical protein